MPSLAVRALIMCLNALSAAAALAHSTVTSTDPPSGSILPASPARIVIDFNEPARPISVTVVTAGAPDRKVSFSPATTAPSFTVTEPKLTTGRNEIQWRALSKDGHPVSGSLIIVVKPGAPAPSIPVTPTAQGPHEHDRR